MRENRLLLGLNALLALNLAGCATIGTGQPKVESTRLRTTRLELVQKEGAIGTASVDGSRLIVSVSQVCDVRERYTVRDRQTSEKVNKTPATDWVVLGAGIALTGAGVATVVDAGNVYSDDTSSRNYNAVGQDNAKLIGYGLTAAGVALLAIPVVDAIRAQGEVLSADEHEEDGPIVERGTKCASAPKVSVEISLVPIGSVGKPKKLQLGETNASGQLDADLDAILPKNQRYADSKFSVYADEVKLVDLDLIPVLSGREARAWEELDIPKCKTPAASTSCEPIAKFLEQYSGGPHSREAQAVLAEAGTPLAERAEEEAWGGVNVVQCESGRTVSPYEIDSWCQPLKVYILKFPNGKHVADAKRALAKAEKRRVVVEAQAAAEEERARRAEEQRAKAEEQEERNKVRKRCRSECRVGCSDRINEGSCLEGCIDICVNRGGN